MCAQKYKFPANKFLKANFKHDNFLLCDKDLCNRNGLELGTITALFKINSSKYFFYIVRLEFNTIYVS